MFTQKATQNCGLTLRRIRSAAVMLFLRKPSIGGCFGLKRKIFRHFVESKQRESCCKIANFLAARRTGFSLIITTRCIGNGLKIGFVWRNAVAIAVFQYWAASIGTSVASVLFAPQCDCYVIAVGLVAF